MCPNEKKSEGFILSNESELEIVRSLVEHEGRNPQYVHLTGRNYLTPRENKILHYHLRMIKELKESGIIKSD